MKKIEILLILLILLFPLSGCQSITSEDTTYTSTYTVTTSEETTNPLTIPVPEGLNYQKDSSSGEIYIKGYSGDSTELNIPDTIDGFPVTEIHFEAFADTNLEVIIIPSSVTTFDNSAFANTPWLDTMTDMSPVFVINNIIIDAKKATGDVVIPYGVQSIPSSAFSGTSVTSVFIPDSVVDIGPSAFKYSSLSSINIPSSVKKIYHGAFENTNLTSIYIPASVTHIYDSVFKDSLLESITFEEGSKLEYIGGYSFVSTNITSIIIPASVMFIGHIAFFDNEGLIIYAEAPEKPDNWLRQWNTNDYPVVWGYSG
jgi:hypothetical protein